jgi:hypothetical protein
MSKADIGFFQEQQPNGKIANSEMRLLVATPIVMAFIYLIYSLYMNYIEVTKLLVYLHDRILTGTTYLPLREGLKPVDYIVLGSLIGLSLGGKIYQKGQENKALANEQNLSSPKDTTETPTSTTTTTP